MTIFTMVLPGCILLRVWDLFLIKKLPVLYQTMLAILTLLEPELVVRDTGEIAEYLSNIRERIADPEEFIKVMISFNVKKKQIKIFEREYDALENHTNSRNKEKLSTGGDDNFKLPPLRNKPLRIKSTEPMLTAGIFLKTLSRNHSPLNKPGSDTGRYLRTISGHLSPSIKANSNNMRSSRVISDNFSPDNKSMPTGPIVRARSGNFSPSNKPTTVPLLPNIRRDPKKKKSFGITNKSCDITINVEHTDI